MAQKPQLPLTGELEKLEQSITLTLQEIDHNFARAHRIVTTSILPIVERYAKESEAVWEGSKFWKQFFETSANVALSNYQEQDTVYGDQNDRTEVTENTVQNTYTEESTYPASSPGHYPERTTDITREQDTHHTMQGHSDDEDGLMDDSLLESLNLTGGATQSTPRKREKEPQWADMESPFETLRKELTMKNYDSPDVDPEPPQTAQRIPVDLGSTISSIMPPTTPQQQRHIFDPETPDSSPLREPPQASYRTPSTVNNDPVIHRILDKTWRLQATPLGKPPPSRYRTAATPKGQIFSKKPSYLDDSPGSSPVEPVLHTQVFTPGAMRTPKPKQYGAAAAAAAAERQETYMYEEEDSDDILLPPGMSPPKTMQFSLPPSKLLATPAREASKRIVHDILETAGASLDYTQTTEDSSPPRGGAGFDDDPF